MIKAIILLSLVAFSCSKSWQVDIYRGNVHIASGSMNFSELTPAGIILRNVEFGDKALDNDNSYNYIMFSNEGGSEMTIPLRNAQQFVPHQNQYLGKVFVTDFVADNGDIFELRIVFGFCGNDYEFDEMAQLLDELEQNRLISNARLNELFGQIKKHAAEHIALANLLDDHDLSREQKIAIRDKLNEEIKGLEISEKAVEDNIEVSEKEQFKKEQQCSEVCSQVKIHESNIYSYTHEKDTIASKLSAVNAEIENIAQVGETDSEELNAAYIQIITTIDLMRSFNNNLQKPNFVKEEYLEAEALKQYFASIK